MKLSSLTALLLLHPHLTLSSPAAAQDPEQQFLDNPNLATTPDPPLPYPPTVSHLLLSFFNLQSSFFSSKLGTYPTAIDWTAAVTQTHLSSTLHTLLLHPTIPASDTLPLLKTYTPHLLRFYETQNVGSLRYQAYDDMLWVVLGWLSAVRFLDSLKDVFPGEVADGGSLSGLYGHRKKFALRAKEFYGYAEKGWDELFCGGGCIWNPNLKPYKNAITNELWISASVEMYRTFPAEWNDDEVIAKSTAVDDGDDDEDDGDDRDKTYLLNAKKAWKWFQGSNFTNDAGLVVDGFHISSYWKRLCDERDEQTFTYNQGVVLSGLRGMWEETGEVGYLEEGYKIVESIVGSAGKIGGLVRDGVVEEHCDSWGWCSQDAQTFKGIFFHHLTAFCSPYQYTGTVEGEAEDAEDAEVYIEDGKVDTGLEADLEPLPDTPSDPVDTYHHHHHHSSKSKKSKKKKSKKSKKSKKKCKKPVKRLPKPSRPSPTPTPSPPHHNPPPKTPNSNINPQLSAHLAHCRTYTSFISLNAAAAWNTRHPSTHTFGQWWSAPLFENDTDFELSLKSGFVSLRRDHRAVDLISTQRGGGWRFGATEAEIRRAEDGTEKYAGYEGLKGDDGEVEVSQEGYRIDHTGGGRFRGDDLNDRFRGRTLETQTGGVGVTRAVVEWEVLGWWCEFMGGGGPKGGC